MSRTKPPLWLEELGWADTYDVLELAGWGGMGRVYKAWHRGLRSCVALKLIDPSRVEDARQLARFEKEARTLARLQEPVPHPNIVRVIDFKLTPTVGCLVMAYVPGPNIRSWCLRQKLDFRQRASLLAKAARAVGFMHRNGVVHRDLKPSNILVHEDTHEPVIVDLGVAQTNCDVTLTLPEQAVGTMHYMAPEQLVSGRKDTGPRSDVYALGTLLYELLTGTLPHPGNITEIARRHQQEVSPTRPSVLTKALPKDLEIICLKALAHRPHERYLNGTALAEDLERYLQGDRIHARRRSVGDVLWRQVQRHRALSAALTGCVLLGGFALVKSRAMQREREAAQLDQEISAGIISKPWHADRLERLEHEITLLSRDAPGRAGELRVMLRGSAVQSIRNQINQPRLEPADIQRLEKSIAWIGRQQPAHGKALREALDARQARWETVIDLHPPFTGAERFFENPSAITVTPAALIPVHPVPPLIPLAVQAGGNVEITANFKPQTLGLHHAGFTARVGDTSYEFVLTSVKGLKASIEGTLVDRDRTDRTAVLAIMRNDSVLRAESVFTPGVLATPIQLTARMEGGRLSLELNHAHRIEFDDLFTSGGPVRLALKWQPSAHLTGLSVSTMSLPLKATPLEQGDSLAAHGKWVEAGRAYTAMNSDPTFSAEATFKAAMCEHALGNGTGAAAHWQKLMNGPPSKWRDLATFHLWKHHAMAGRPDLARPCFEQLAANGTLSPSLRRATIQGDIAIISRTYRNTACGLNALRPNPDVEIAVRAHRFLGHRPLDVALRFALARHCNGTDDLARSLFSEALHTLKPRELAGRQRENALLCLDLWTWMEPPEREVWLSDALKLWQQTQPADEPATSFLALEQARQLARSGQQNAARDAASAVRRMPAASERSRVSAVLLEAVLSDANAGQVLLREAAQALNSDPRTLPIPAMCDRYVLRSAAHAWTPGTLANFISRLISSGQSGAIAETMQSQFGSAFLDDPAFLNAANTVFDDEPGQALLQAYALRSRPARELIAEAARLLSRRYFAESAFPTPLAEENSKRIDRAVNLMLQDFARGRFHETDFFMVMQSLRHPQLQPFLANGMSRWNEALKREISWLLDQRNKLPAMVQQRNGL